MTMTGFMTVREDTPRGYSTSAPEEARLREELKMLEAALPTYNIFRYRTECAVFWCAERKRNGGTSRFQHPTAAGLVEMVRGPQLG